MKAIQDFRPSYRKHTVSVLKKITEELPVKIARHIRKLDIRLIGEQITDKEDRSPVTVRIKGYLEIRGIASNFQMKRKFLDFIEEKADGRKIKDLINY